MSASMADLLAAHYEVHIFGPRCRCGMSLGRKDERYAALAAHQADVLAANRYGKLTAVQLAARDRPESMEAARAKVRAGRRAAQAEDIRAAQEIAWAKGATSAGANLMELQASGINPNPYRKESEETFADRMARRSIEALHAKYPQGRPE